MIFLSITAVMGFFITVIMGIYDYMNDGVLNDAFRNDREKPREIIRAA